MATRNPVMLRIRSSIKVGNICEREEGTGGLSLVALKRQILHFWTIRLRHSSTLSRCSLLESLPELFSFYDQSFVMLMSHIISSASDESNRIQYQPPYEGRKTR